MLLSFFLILMLTLVGCMFHAYFSFALAALVGSIVFNYQGDLLISILSTIMSFSAMTLMKLYIGKNLWDGLIDFDTKKIQEA